MKWESSINDIGRIVDLTIGDSWIFIGRFIAEKCTHRNIINNLSGDKYSRYTHCTFWFSCTNTENRKCNREIVQHY